jgi:hypothetical protein
MTDHYIEHTKRETKKYLDAYKEFESNLTPEERKLLGNAASPLVESAVTHGMSPIGDLAESAIATSPLNMGDHCDSLHENLAEQFKIPVAIAKKIAAWHLAVVEREGEERKAAVVARIAGAFLNASNVKLTSAGLAYAAGLNSLNGLGTMAEYAASIGVSRQAVSKVAKQWQEELSLPNSSHMRDEEACKTYSAVQKTNHWRKKTCKKKMRLFR